MRNRPVRKEPSVFWARRSCVQSRFSETSGSHNELIVVRDICFRRVMKLSTALAASPLPPCYLCVMGAADVTLRLYSIKRSHLCSFSGSPHHSRAVLCQRRGVGASHLLLLQRDRHGVQLPGEGTDPVPHHTPLSRKQKDIWNPSMFTSNANLREDVRVVPPLPTLAL